MVERLVSRVLGGAAGTFVREARRRGLSARVARTLEGAAREVAPDGPSAILSSRELFEAAAKRAVVGDGGNLELSFYLVDELATALEALGLGRASDVPDPFRRVWVRGGDGSKIRGVVLGCEGGEVAVFCPPSERALAELGGVLWLAYRGLRSSVEYDLLLDDAVRLPGALVLHLKRRTGGGAIGRTSVRYRTDLRGVLTTREEASGVEREQVCRVVDLSDGGAALEVADPPRQGDTVRLQFPMPDGHGTPFTSDGEVRWVREGAYGTRGVGVAFEGLPRLREERLARFLERLEDGEFGEDGPHDVLPGVAASRPVAEEPSPAPADRAFHLESPPPPATTVAPAELVTAVCEDLAEAFGEVTGRCFTCGDVELETPGEARALGVGSHVVFKFDVRRGGVHREGAVALPLGEASRLAALYAGLPHATGEASRVLKVALLQLAELVSHAVERATRRTTRDACRVRSMGCWMLEPEERPPVEGERLVHATSLARLDGSDPYELYVLLPEA